MASEIFYEITVISERAGFYIQGCKRQDITLKELASMANPTHDNRRKQKEWVFTWKLGL